MLRPGKEVRFAAVALGFMAGALLDFLIYGVGKIIWAVIYVPIYGVAGSALHTWMLANRWAPFFRAAYLALLAGAILSRVAFVGHHRVATYTMVPTATQPFTLRSPAFPRKLIVSSEQLALDLAGKPAEKELEVKVDVISDYGCISSFLVSTVDGVDVKSDPKASWTWKADGAGAGDRGSGPGLEDQELIWCRIHFYRPSS